MGRTEWRAIYNFSYICFNCLWFYTEIYTFRSFIKCSVCRNELQKYQFWLNIFVSKIISESYLSCYNNITSVIRAQSISSCLLFSIYIEIHYTLNVLHLLHTRTACFMYKQNIWMYIICVSWKKKCANGTEFSYNMSTLLTFSSLYEYILSIHVSILSYSPLSPSLFLSLSHSLSLSF